MFYQVTFPTVLRKGPLSQLWYKPDMLFSTPKVHIIIDFHCPLSSHSPEAVVATELFVDLLVDYLNAYGKHESVNLVYFYIFPMHNNQFREYCQLKVHVYYLPFLQLMMLKLLVYSIQYILLRLDSRYFQLQ